MPQHAILPGPLCQLRRAPPAQVRAPHHVCSLQVPKRKRQHRRQARLAGGGAVDAVVPTFCYIEAVLGMRLCDPDQLIGKKRRNKLTAADTLFATSRDVSLFGEDEHDSGFTDTRWVAGARRAVRLRKSRLNSALKKHRKTEQEAADKAIVELGM